MFSAVLTFCKTVTNTSLVSFVEEEVEVEVQNKEEPGFKDSQFWVESSSLPGDSIFTQTSWSCAGS